MPEGPRAGEGLGGAEGDAGGRSRRRPERVPLLQRHACLRAAAWGLEAHPGAHQGNGGVVTLLELCCAMRKGGHRLQQLGWFDALFVLFFFVRYSVHAPTMVDDGMQLTRLLLSSACWSFNTLAISRHYAEGTPHRDPPPLIPPFLST